MKIFRNILSKILDANFKLSGKIIKHFLLNNQEDQELMVANAILKQLGLCTAEKIFIEGFYRHTELKKLTKAIEDVNNEKKE